MSNVLIKTNRRVGDIKNTKEEIRFFSGSKVHKIIDL